MNLTDLSNKRGVFNTAMQDLLDLLATGSYTPEQKSGLIDTATQACFQLCRTAKEVRRANRTTITTEDFYARPDLPLCDVLDNFHTSIGGTHMYEMFCNEPAFVPVRDNACTNPPQPAVFPEGPMVIQYVAGTNILTGIYGFEGTIEYQDGSVDTYDTPTDIAYSDVPDDGNGYGAIMLRGTVASFNHYANGEPGYKPIADVPQWGTECVVKDWSYFFFRNELKCFTISAVDQPLFGTQPNGDVFGTSCVDMFYLTYSYWNADLSHWDTSQVTNMYAMFGSCYGFNSDLSNWDTSNVTDMSYMFDNAKSFNQDLSGWDTGNVTIMMDMFKDATAFNQDLSGWDVSKVVTSWDFNTGGQMPPQYKPAFTDV